MKKKISDENKGRLSNNEVFGFSMVLGEKMSGCIEQYLEDKNEVNVYYSNKRMNSLIKKKSGVEKVIFKISPWW